MFFGETYRREQGFAWPPVHDPCAVAYVIDPQVMTVRKVPLDVELQGALTLGMTVADFRAPPPPDCHSQVAVQLNHAMFWQMVETALRHIGEGGQ
ncbi:nucleoside hydrolase [Aquitalea sp. LB_tupeE]|uniref:nucleoside hydrolase n=1 Tax=Aquitalea sp. LB_tupeE TaxID=2748078 RepID=UPI001C4C7045